MTQYIGIHSEGGLIPYDVLDKIAKEESGLGQQAKDFDLPAGRRLTDEIARAWSDAQDYWHIFQRRSSSLPENETGATLTRKWITDLLNELLGYELAYQQTGAVIGGKNYPISHRAGISEESPPVQIEGFRADLDRRPQARRLSPQALVQEYLNNSDNQLWGIVTNGFLLRFLRDTSRTSRPSYLEFDLQSILEGNRFNEFALFYRVCHRTRLPRTAEDSTSCWLEKYFQLSIEQGGRVRDKLRDGVEDALKSLGTGFLRHPNNAALLDRVKKGTLTAAEFHRELLRLVYRLLFLMVAEERRMIVPESPEADRRQNLFDRYYSVGRLRGLAEKAIEPSTFGDLWVGLQQTFTLFEDGDSNPLGIPPLNGDLFSAIVVKNLQGTHLYNDVLLATMARLSLFEDSHVRQRVNYSALDVEELGSVYESLLDFQPVFTEQPEGMTFELRIGSERKSTGSYYTRPELVRELIESALVPVMQDRLASAKDGDADRDKEKKQQAILSMSVCDPACGSGHFLLAAARRLGRELAKVRTGEDEPTPQAFHLAVRDVISHCVHGVDVNPLAVDLCKLALWLEGHWTGKPLSFLDHRIKCGNSLIGVLDMDVLKDGIPDEAFNPVTGDDKKVASAFKKKNRDERRGQPALAFDPVEHIRHYASESEECVGMAEDTPADVRRKKEAYDKSRLKPDWWRDWVSASVWTSTFFVSLTDHDDPTVPTNDKFAKCLVGGHVDGQLQGASLELAEELNFFHWPLEFPEVFERGGFDLLLGNPPWEKIRLSEEEHWIDDDYITGARNKAERSKRINEYRNSDNQSKVARVNKFEAAKHHHEAISKFVRSGSRFPLTAVGDVNTYALFAELNHSLVAPTGRFGVIVPVNIATDDTTKNFFGALVKSNNLVRLIGFENEAFIFPAVHHAFKFCALVCTGSAGDVDEFDFVFFCRYFEQVQDARRQFQLSASDFELLNPNTRTCPVFRTRADAEITKKLYQHVPALVNETKGADPWSIQFQSMFHMANDSAIFRNESGPELLPLYEAKMLWQFDHRFSTYQGATEANLNSSILPQPSEQEKADPAFVIEPRYWVPRNEVLYRTSFVPPVLIEAIRMNDEKMISDVMAHWLASYCRQIGNEAGEKYVREFIPVSLWQSGQAVMADFIRQEGIVEAWAKHWPLDASDFEFDSKPKDLVEFASKLVEKRAPKWLVAFREVTNSTNERTMIVSVLPFVAVGHKAPLVRVESKPLSLVLSLVANLNSLVLDYIARQKIGGTSMSYFIVKQLPVIPPTLYRPEDLDFIVERVAQLVYTSEDLHPIGSALGCSGPYLWNENARMKLRAELDAYYAHLYGVTREELRYILDPKEVFGDDFPSESFRVLKEREQKEYGEYRTRKLVLESFDKLAESPRFQDEMPKRESEQSIFNKQSPSVAT